MTLDAFLDPQAVAVLGASADPEKFSYSLLQNLVEAGFPGVLRAVNPRGGSALGVGFHERVEDLPEVPDLVLAALPAAHLLPALRPCFARGVPAVAVLTSGFAECGPEGRTLQEALVTEARAAGTRLLGPNCLGLVRAPARLAATFYWELPPPELFASQRPGLSILSMSGGLGAMFLQELSRRGLPLSTFVSLGNCADLTAAEFLEALRRDPHTRTVGVFLEGEAPGQWLEAAQRTAAEKPLVLLRAGRSAAGARSALRHTGTPPARPETDRLVSRSGLQVARDSAEWFDLLEARHLCPPARAGVAVISNSGGACVVAADALEDAGLDVPALAPATQALLSARIPPFGCVANPVDTTAAVEDDDCEAILRAILADPAVGAVLVISVGLDYPGWVPAGAAKPVVVCTFDAPAMERACRASGVPHAASVEAGVRMVHGLVQVGESSRVPG